MKSKTMKISAFSVLVSFVALAIVGAALLLLIPVKLSPSATLPGLSVYFNMPNTSARVIEMEATSKLEAMLSRIQGVKNINSTSGNGWARITIDLNKHVDIEMARFEASTIVRQTWHELPEGVSYPRIQLKRPDEDADRAFVIYTISAPASASVIQDYTEDQIQTRLSSLSGIYKINVTGATPMEWQIKYDQDQLESLGITVQQITQAIQNYYNQEHFGTVLYASDNWIRLALMPNIEEGFDASKIVVADREGKLVKLSQLVDTKRVEEQPRNYFRINGLNSIYLSIWADEQANQIQLASQIKEEVKRIESILPQGYEMYTSYDATNYINKELDKIYVRTGLTILILLLFVLLVSKDLRYLLMIVISLTLNLFVAFIFYYLFGLELQLYSLAGVTISLSLIIDNIIVMADHLRIQQNRRAFLAILTATLTTIGALGVIFLLDESIRLNLQDFAAVVIINLVVSLFVALFLVPALIEKIGFTEQKAKKRIHNRVFRFLRRFPIYFTGFYRKQILFMMRWRKLSVACIILAFGFPIFLLPDKMEMPVPEKGKEHKVTKIDTLFVEGYNKLAANSLWKEDIRPILDKSLGGTLRLFMDDVYNGSYFTRNDELVLQIGASMPNGTTLPQMNHLVEQMESYLSTHDKEIRQFQTRIHSARQANISVYFTEESENTAFPFELKNNIISRALELGGGSWNVWGLPDNQAFNNNVREYAGSYQITMYGYNYDELFEQAHRLRDSLLTYRRIKEVLISSRFSYYKDDYREFFFDLDGKRLIEEQISPMQLFGTLRETMIKGQNVRSLYNEDQIEQLTVSSSQSSDYDVWNFENSSFTVDDRIYKLSDLATLTQMQAPIDIVKENQQYLICVQYDYIGSGKLGNRIQERVLKSFEKDLPMGYTVKGGYRKWGWNKEQNQQYLLLLVIVAIIFFTTSILFNSLRQPLAIIFLVPVSFIGVFLAFYLFGVNFDQGGFASFVLLCGITVNTSIYVLNEYNELKKSFPKRDSLWLYLRAWNYKVMPIFLTVISTILGFVPFLIGETKEAFWFPMAVGTIGGLIMSVISIYLYLPLFTLNKKALEKA